MEKSSKIINNINQSKERTPDLTNKTIMMQRNRTRKTDPLFEPVQVLEQDKTKIIGLTSKNKITTANLQKIKRLRRSLSLQTRGPAEDDPGPSDQSHSK